MKRSFTSEFERVTQSPSLELNLRSAPGDASSPLVWERKDEEESISSSDKDRDGRPWSTGPFSRFPMLSLTCLCIIFACGVSSVVVLLNSDGKDVHTWGSSKTLSKVTGHREKHHNVSVAAWHALFVFIAEKALEGMFLEGIAISWWVHALRGQSLRKMNYRWEVSLYTSSVFKNPKLFGWTTVASILFALFAGLEC